METEKGKSKGKQSRNWVHSTTRENRRSSKEKPPPKPLRGQDRRVVPPHKRPDLQKDLGTYKEVLTNIKIAYLLCSYEAMWPVASHCCISVMAIH
jgi:hypothetical protein